MNSLKQTKKNTYNNKFKNNKHDRIIKSNSGRIN